MEAQLEPADLLGPIERHANYQEWPFISEKSALYQLRWLSRGGVDDPVSVVELKFQHLGTSGGHEPTSPLFRTLRQAVREIRVSSIDSLEPGDHGLTELGIVQLTNRADLALSRVNDLREMHHVATDLSWLDSVVYPIFELAGELQQNREHAVVIKSYGPRGGRKHEVMRLAPNPISRVEAEAPDCFHLAELVDTVCGEKFQDHSPGWLLDEMRQFHRLKLHWPFLANMMQMDIFNEDDERGYWFELAMSCFARFTSVMAIEVSIPEAHRFKNVFDVVLPLCLWSPTGAQLVAATLRSKTKIDIYPLRRWYFTDRNMVADMILVLSKVLDWGTNDFIKWFQGYASEDWSSDSSADTTVP